MLPPTAYRTFSVHCPISTHTRPATCEEADCQAQAQGWRTTVDERTDLGQRQAYYIRKAAGRHFVELREADGRTSFTFPPGQLCFQSHRVSLERPAIFTSRPGDRRMPVARQDVTRYDRAGQWVETFAENQQKLHRIVHGE